MGVPLGTYNFGSGPVSVGDADTIIQRVDTVTVAAAGDTGTTGLKMLALQLQTAAPVNFAGQGVDNYFITLQSTHGGPASLGSSAINFVNTDGVRSRRISTTQTRLLRMDFFDIHKGSLTGAIVYSNVLSLDNNTIDIRGATWQHQPPPSGAVVINGANHLLNGADTSTDFWPVMQVQPGQVFPLVGPGAGPHGFGLFGLLADIELNKHVYHNAMVPEPGTWIMGVIALMIVSTYARWRRAQPSCAAG